MLDDKFQKVEDEYFTLAGKLNAGRIRQEQFDEAMKELMVEHEGRYWVIGGKSGKWHMHDGQNWVKAEPPRAGPAPAVASVRTRVEQTGDSFIMRIEDVFQITGRGTVVTGVVERGSVRVGDTVELIGLRGTRTTVVTALESFRKALESARAGDNVGCFLQGVSRQDVEAGMVLAAPNSVQTATEFECDMYLLKDEEGGRKSPLTEGQRLDVFIRTRDVSCEIHFPPGISSIAPGETRKVIVRSVTPLLLTNIKRVAFRERGRTIGGGDITQIFNS